MRRGFVDGRWVVAFLIVVPIAIAIGASLVPRLGPREFIRHQVDLLLKAHLPSPVGWRRVDVSLDPPRVIVRGVTAGSASGSEPVFRAETVTLEVDPEPLRQGIVELQEVTIEDMALRIEWTGQKWSGFEHRDPTTPASSAESNEVVLANNEQSSDKIDKVPEWRIERGRVWIVDRSVEPAREFELSQVKAQIRPHEDRTSMLFDGRFLGGALVARAQGSLLDAFTMSLDLEDLDLASFGAYAPARVHALGRVSGTVEIVGTGPSQWKVESDLHVREADWSVKSLDLRGDLDVQAEIHSTTEGGVAGVFRIGALGAALEMGDDTKKPPGRLAEVIGDFRIGPDRQLEIGSFRLSAVDSGEVQP